jgi:hypothetical protein
MNGRREKRKRRELINNGRGEERQNRGKSLDMALYIPSDTLGQSPSTTLP